MRQHRPTVRWFASGRRRRRRRLGVDPLWRCLPKNATPGRRQHAIRGSCRFGFIRLESDRGFRIEDRGQILSFSGRNNRSIQAKRTPNTAQELPACRRERRRELLISKLRRSLSHRGRRRGRRTEEEERATRRGIGTPQFSRRRRLACEGSGTAAGGNPGTVFGARGKECIPMLVMGKSRVRARGVQE
jgi:hypothetical protein